MHSLPDDALPETLFLSPFSDRACPPANVSSFDSITSFAVRFVVLVARASLKLVVVLNEYYSMPPTRRGPSTGSHELHYSTEYARIPSLHSWGINCTNTHQH